MASCPDFEREISYWVVDFCYPGRVVMPCSYTHGIRRMCQHANVGKQQPTVCENCSSSDKGFHDNHRICMSPLETCKHEHHECYCVVRGWC